MGFGASLLSGLGMISSTALADLYADPRKMFREVKLSPAAWKVFKHLAYEQGSRKMLWGRPIEVVELPEGVWTETDRGHQLLLNG